MTSETEGRPGADRDAAANVQTDYEPYVPPTVEDIDTTHEPAEVVAGGAFSPVNAAEDSTRWH